MASQATDVPESKRLLYAFGWAVSEINNGGIHQLFFNSAGDVVPDAITAARRAGAASVADVIEKAAELLGDPYPTDRSQRQAALDALSRTEVDRLDGLTDQYYEAESGVDLRAVMRTLAAA